ncbi:LysM peptidoglycan-binding domain-containing protein [Desulfoluna sp.]|uniref:LysM peptidoglycan-binding domain-containing protein n=1 Tax=Desulfoluna sp. TaxID=2045199 RepID=UPI002629C028|nr:LysM peptidoglycan-binding domain-containing protein [Desulfoluna sp.]
MKQPLFLSCALVLLTSACTSSTIPLASKTPRYPYIGIEATAPEPVEFNFATNLRNISLELPEETEAELPLFDRAIEYCKAAQTFWEKGDMDGALSSLDEAYGLILQVDTENAPLLLQQKEDLRFTISRRILEIYTSRTTTASFTRNAIPITINQQVQREIDIFTKKDRRFFSESLKRAGKYRPMMLQKLQEAGLPAELSWLPLVESGFKVKALSSARALGLWQFVPSTGYMYGLKRTTFVDERLDPEKATDAAIAYLERLHKLFGDWSTVLAAYNCGEGRVLKTIRRQNINYLDNFWDLYSRLPSETRRYVPKFIATLHIANNLKKYGFDKVTPDAPDLFDTVTVQKQVKLSDVARAISASHATMKKLNPELRYTILPKESYTLRVPVGKGEAVQAAMATLRVSLPPQRAFVYHKVKSGDTLSSLAKRYRTSIKTISKANGLSNRHIIVVGKKIKIPQRGYTTRGYYANTPLNGTKRPTRHVVHKGESLWLIARKYGTTPTEIKEVNRLSSNTLKVGQVLSLPQPKAPKARTAKKSVYYVKRGDNPFTIATKHNISVARLLKVNNLTPGSTIYPGQRLYID